MNVYSRLPSLQPRDHPHHVGRTHQSPHRLRRRRDHLPLRPRTVPFVAVALVPTQALSVRSHLLAVHVDAYRKVHLQCVLRTCLVLLATDLTFVNHFTSIDSILFLFLSMVTIAVALYLPRHVSIIAHRAYYYLSGDLLKNGTASDVLGTTADILTPTTVAEVAGSA